MNIPALSDQSLKDMHALIKEALGADDAHQGAPKPFGVRGGVDWRIQADAYETELTSRNISYDPIRW